LKRSLKLDFDEIEKTRTFFSMTKLNLNNNALDSTQMREALAYDVFRRAGVTASRTAYAKVFITVPGKYKEEYAGLFTIVEQVDQSFFNDRWRKKVGVLLKPERLNGTPYLGDDWKNYEQRYVSKVTAKSEDAARVIGFIKFINQASDDDFSRRIGEYIDVDQFLKFLAAEVVIVNTDSPLAMNHNYWLTVHPDSKKVVWVPWDMNMAFGGFMADHELSIHKPSNPGTFPFADRMLANKVFRERYDQIVREMLAANVNVERLGEQIRAISDAVRDAIAAEKPPTNAAGFGGDPGFFGRGGFGSPRRFGPGASAPPLREFVANRVESVLAQLDGKSEGTPGRGGFGGRGGPPGLPGGPPPFGPGPQGGPFGRGQRQ
jgi:spore coat protein H